MSKRQYKLRFNLGLGENFMKWKLTKPDGTSEYIDPTTNTIVLVNCKLRNQPSTAQKIHDGAHKTVCAWVEAEEVQVTEAKIDNLIDYKADLRIMYNPRKNPYWTYHTEIESVDNKIIPLIVTENRSLYDIATCYDHSGED